MELSLQLIVAIVVGLMCCNGTFGMEELIKDRTLFKACPIYKPGFTKCFTNNMQTMINKIRTNPELKEHMGRIDPLRIPEMKFEMDVDGITLQANLTNTSLIGLSKLIIKQARLCKVEFSFQIRSFVPLLRFEADYIAEGKIKGVPVNQSGHAIVEMGNVDFLADIETRLGEKGPLTFFNDPKLKLNIRTTNVRTNIRNLFAKALHKNPEGTVPIYPLDMSLFKKALRPFFIKNIGEFYEAEMEKLFSSVPAKAFVSDMPTSVEFYAKKNLKSL